MRSVIVMWCDSNWWLWQVQPDLPSDVQVVSIDCGGNHNLVLTAKGEVYSWGYDEYAVPCYDWMDR